jgi:hypothetical protein
MILCPLLLSGCLVMWWPPSLPRRSLPTATHPASPQASSSGEAFPLPDLPIAELPGAPVVALWSPEPGGQIRASVWRSGSVRGLLVVPLLNPDPVYLDHVRVSVSPNGRFVAVIEAPRESTITTAFIRIFSATGDLVWTGPPDVSASPTTRWSPDGSRFAVDARGRWIVVSPTSSGPADTVEIDTRRPRQAVDQIAYPWELLDFSEDGSTLYGAVMLGVDRSSRPIARATASGGQVEPLAALPTKAGERLAYPSQRSERTLDPAIDPETGRLATLGSCDPTLQCEIEIRGGGRVQRSGPARRFGGVVDLAWQHGSIVILHDDRSGASPVQDLGLIKVGKDLGQERSVASFDLVGQHGRLVAVTDDFVLLGFGRGLPERPSRLVLVRLSDGARSAIDLDGASSTPELFGFAGWLRE